MLKFIPEEIIVSVSNSSGFIRSRKFKSLSILDQPVAFLNLSELANVYLSHMGIYTIRHLVLFSSTDLELNGYFGFSGIMKIRAALHSVGLKLRGN